MTRHMTFAAVAGLTTLSWHRFEARASRQVEDEVDAVSLAMVMFAARVRDI
jgi:hypothetical protein